MSVSNNNPRISFRPGSADILDEMEIQANRLGQTKYDWLRDAVFEKLSRGKQQLILEQELKTCSLERTKLLRMLAGDEKAKEAREDAVAYLEKVKLYG